MLAEGLPIGVPQQQTWVKFVNTAPDQSAPRHAKGGTHEGLARMRTYINSKTEIEMFQQRLSDLVGHWGTYRIV